MAILNAQQAVNTRDLPELEPITGDTYDGGTMQGAYIHGPSGITYRFGDDDIDLPGTYVFAAAQVISGPIESIAVKTGGNAAYDIADFDLNIEELWADAGDNGKLDTVPAEIFKGDDTLNGSPFADILYGFDGSDVITGGGGRDEMNGGDGPDAFVFLALSDSTKKASGRDSILDFDRAEADQIDLTAIDARKGSGNQDFDFIGKKDFHDKKGELRYVVKNGDAIVQGDTNGDGKADFSIHVDGVSQLKAFDFDL